jgi:acyl carrier protein
MLTQQEIEAEICKMLAKVADSLAEEIDPTRPFDSFGLDSLSKVGVITELSKRVAFEIDTEEAVEYETPRELAAFVAQKLAMAG